MKLLNTAAIIALASAGLAAQSFQERFQAMQPELERQIASMQYKEVIDKVEAIMPPVTPEFKKDPEDIDVGLNSYQELQSIQSFHVYLGRACAMFGDSEKALFNLKKAEEIANLVAAEAEFVFGPRIEQWSVATENAEKQLGMQEEISKIKEQIEGEKKEIEAKRRQNNADKQRLAQIAEAERRIQTYLSSIPAWEELLQRAPVAVEQLNQYIAMAKEDTAKFAPAIQGLEEDLQAEKELIASRFDGDKVRYVTSVVETKENLDRLQNQADKVKFLNRLLFLDPQNETAKKQLDAVLSRAR